MTFRMFVAAVYAVCAWMVTGTRSSLPDLTGHSSQLGRERGADSAFTQPRHLSSERPPIHVARRSRKRTTPLDTVVLIADWGSDCTESEAARFASAQSSV